jgi:hypothetical protein
MALWFRSFDTDPTDVNVGTHWASYLSGFNRFLLLNDIKEDDRKKAGIIELGGPAISSIYDQLEINPPTVIKTEGQEDKTEAGKIDTYTEVCEKLTKYFNPRKSVLFEKIQFRKVQQNLDEPLKAYVMRLRLAAKHCDFDNVDQEICAQIVLMGSSDWLTQKILSFSSVDETKLENILRVGCAKELSAQ